MQSVDKSRERVRGARDPRKSPWRNTVNSPQGKNESLMQGTGVKFTIVRNFCSIPMHRNEDNNPARGISENDLQNYADDVACGIMQEYLTIHTERLPVDVVGKTRVQDALDDAFATFAPLCM